MPPFAVMKYLLVCGVDVASRHHIRFRWPPALDSLSGPQSMYAYESQQPEVSETKMEGLESY